MSSILADHSKGVIIEYSYPRTSCTVHIELVCGDDTEEPRVERTSDSCTVEIVWKTNFVCYKGIR